jgi:TonB family protein
MSIPWVSPFRLYAILLAFSTVPITVHATESVDNRASTAQTLSDGVSHLKFHKVYVPDFCDSSSRPDGPGAYFAANFSFLLGHNSKDFTVLSRVDGHRYLIQNHWNDCDLARPEILQKFVAALDVDALLTGSVQSEKNYFHVDLLLRDVSGNARIHCVYDEPFRPDTLAFFPASTSSSGWPFYFPRLDGVTSPTPMKTSPFPYPASYKPVILSGTVVISMVVTTDGNVEQARIVQKVDPDFDSDTLKIIRTWHFEPAKSPDGTPVPIRIGIQLRFRAKGMPAQAQYPEDHLQP